MTLELTVLRDVTQPGLPTDGEFARWAAAALGDTGGPCSLAIRIVDPDESRRLNREYRDRDSPTNVLSFPAGIPDRWIADIGFRPLGDIVICASLVDSEARAQERPTLHHWAHLTVHGVLHLLGYDHEDDVGAREMEGRERRILEQLGIPDPYRGE